MEINRQYIGARYVPKFADPIEWDKLRDYEAMVIVTYHGTSYTSKKPVPVGTELNNTEYWVVTGNYNAQIEEYREEVQGVREDLNNVETEIETMRNATRKRVILIGDSYCVQVDGSGNTIPVLVQNALGLGNTDFYSASLGGSAFYNPDYPDYTFLALLKTLENSVTDKVSITDIMVIGGANDAARTPSDTLGAISAFMTYAKTNYKNARVSLFGCGITFTCYTLPTNIDNLVKTWKSGALYGACYVPNSEFVMRNTELLTDHDLCHPNANGVQEIAKQVVIALNQGSVNVNYDLKLSAPTITVPNKTVTVLNTAGFMSQKNGTVSIATTGGQPYTVTFTTDSAVDLAIGGEITVKFQQSLISGYHDATIYTYTKDIYVYDMTTSKRYNAVAIPRLTVDTRCYISILLKEAIPSTDNVTSLALDLSGIYFA